VICGLAVEVYTCRLKENTTICGSTNGRAFMLLPFV